jgi:hypothetical protein
MSRFTGLFLSRCLPSSRPARDGLGTEDVASLGSSRTFGWIASALQPSITRLEGIENEVFKTSVEALIRALLRNGYAS